MADRQDHRSHGLSSGQPEVGLGLSLGCRFRRLQPLELGIADLGLGHQHAAAQALDQIAADRAEPPRQRPLRAVADDDEMRADFFGNLGNFLAGIADLEPRGRVNPSAFSRSVPSFRMAL